MKVELKSRRMFLQGAGGALLAIPSLPSLLWKLGRAHAQDSTPPVRYVQWITNHGQFDENFWPASMYAPTEPADIGGASIADIKVRPLSAIPGPLSPVLSNAFDPVRNKLNLIRGLDLIVGKGYHNACVPTCASWPRQIDHVPTFSYSVDSILETSTKVYPTPVRMPALRLTPGVNSAFKWGSFCWTTQNGKPLKLPAYEKPQAALDAIFVDTSSSTAIAAQTAKLQLIDQVKDDYRRVGNLSALGSSDRQLLSNYIDLLADVQRRTSSDVSACKTPAQAGQTDFDILHQNATDIAIAAMICGATRVVAYHCYQGSPTQYDEGTFHTWSHNDAPKHGEMMLYRYRQLARMLHVMDQVKDSDGTTLLDNALVYAGNELSEPFHGSKHLQNMPVLVAGGAAGALTTGNYIDFSGRLLNNLLITIFNTMGLSPFDYQRNNVIGFGDYEGPNAQNYQRYLTTAQRHSALPYLYRTTDSGA